MKRVAGGWVQPLIPDPGHEGLRATSGVGASDDTQVGGSSCGARGNKQKEGNKLGMTLPALTGPIV